VLPDLLDTSLDSIMDDLVFESMRDVPMEIEWHSDAEEPDAAIDNTEVPAPEPDVTAPEPDVTADGDNYFNVDLPIEPVVLILERSIREDPIPAVLPEEVPVTWEVVPSGTTRGKPRLHSTDGYTYTAKRETARGTYWVCSIRQKDNKCLATIIQRGGSFLPGCHPHNHLGKQGSLVTTKVTVAVKERLAVDDFVSAASVVEEELMAY
jgi:hypothetical protein